MYKISKSLLIITVSPDLIRITQRWSSTSRSLEYSHQNAFLSDASSLSTLLFIVLSFILIIASLLRNSSTIYCSFNIQHFLYFFPLPHGHGSLRPIFFPTTTVPDFFCSKYSVCFVSASKISSHIGRL